MLPAQRRLRRAADITSTVRSGRRCGSPLIVVHYLPRIDTLPGSDQQPTMPCTFALAVGKSVGNSVVRHRVSRRLRHLLRGSAADWDDVASKVVVRALPGSSDATSTQLSASLERCLTKARNAHEDTSVRAITPAGVS